MQNLDKHQITAAEAQARLNGAAKERARQKEMAAAQEQTRLKEAIKNAKAQRKAEANQAKLDSKPKGGVLHKLKCCVM